MTTSGPFSPRLSNQGSRTKFNARQLIHVDWEDPSLEIVSQTVLKKYCSLIHGQPVPEAVLDLKRGTV